MAPDLRRLTASHGALLILDEVISGFRLGPGGAAALFGVTPDLATFGKVIGGGMPVGAIAGPRELMRHLSPEGTVYQAGTLSGNPLAMAAGIATLRVLERERGWTALERLGAALEESLRPVLERAPLPARLVRLGSIFWLCLQETAPRSAEAVSPAAGERYRPLFHALLERGISLAPSAYEVGFLSTAHTPQDISRLATAVGALLGTAA